MPPSGPPRRLPALALVLVLAALLRLSALERVPLGFFSDEAAVALEARSLAETGRDLHGRPWPFFLRALDDWKAPAFIYGVAGWSRVAGDDVRAARAFAAVCGLFSILGAWLLAREVLGPGPGPLLVAGLLAVSPWHLQFSRIAWQAITLVLLHTWAVALLLRGTRRSSSAALCAGAALLGLVLWTYSPARLWVPLLGLAFLGATVGTLRRWPWSPRASALALLCFALAAAPFALAAARYAPELALRFRSESLFAQGGGPLDVLAAWAAHLSPGFLFLQGDPIPRHSPPGVGQMLLAEAPLLLLGLVGLWRDRTPAARLVLLWLLLAPLLGALTRDAPHATRTIALLPALQLAVARGVLLVVRAAGPRARLVNAALAAVLALSAGHATWLHFTSPARIDPAWWRPGLTRVVETAAALAARAAPPARVHFLPGTRVTHVDWLYVTRYPLAQVHAHAQALAAGRERYDPLDTAGRFEFSGASFHYGPRPIVLRPGELVVGGPADAPLPGAPLELLHEDGAARYWRVR